MQRVPEALMDPGAEQELWTGALSFVLHVLHHSLKAGKDVTPLGERAVRRLDRKRFHVWGSHASITEPSIPPRRERVQSVSTGGLQVGLAAAFSKKTARMGESCRMRIRVTPANRNR